MLMIYWMFDFNIRLLLHLFNQLLYSIWNKQTNDTFHLNWMIYVQCIQSLSCSFTAQTIFISVEQVSFNFFDLIWTKINFVVTCSYRINCMWLHFISFFFFWVFDTEKFRLLLSFGFVLNVRTTLNDSSE